MRLLLLVLVAGCGDNHGQDITCSAANQCAGGRSYRFCGEATAQGCSVGHYELSDGTNLACATCAECQAQAVEVAAWCATGTLELDLGVGVDFGPRPDLSGGDLAQPANADLSEVDNPDMGLLTIPKIGPGSGVGHMDPGLNTPADCADQNLEPNDSPTQALSFTPMPDVPSPKIIKVAICPKDAHDQDWYQVDNSGPGSPLTLKAEVFYDVHFGDLDVAIVNSQGTILASDGTSVSNACVAVAIPRGIVYVVVTGANNDDVNNYEVRLNTFTTGQTCP